MNRIHGICMSRLSLKNYKEKKTLWQNLLKKGAKADEELFDYFFNNNDYGMEYYFAPNLAFAAAYCDIETLKLIKKQGYDIGWTDEDGVNLLQIAALCNKAEVVEFFLNQGLNGNIKTDYYQADAVSFAVLGGHLNHAKILEKKR